MNDAKTPPAKPPFAWGRVVLFVSLALNLAVIGIIGGAVLGRFGPGHGGLSARDVGFGLFNEALTEQDRKDLRRAYVKAKPNLRAERRQMREDLQGILTLLRASPFDPAALKTTLDLGVARLAERQSLGQTILLDHLAKMSPEDRAAFAERLETSLKRRDRGERPPKRDGN